MATLRNKIIGCCLIAAFAIFVFCLLPYHYQDCPTNLKEECSTYQVVPFVLIKVGRFLDDHNGAIIAIFTIVLAGSTIGLWLITWCGIRSQLRETKILQRAYLSVEPAGIAPLSKPNNCVPWIDICNRGNLPARNVKWLIKHAPKLDGRFNNFPATIEEAKGKNVVPPGTAMRQGGHIVLVDNSKALAEAIWKEDGLYLYVWGAVFYDDGFGESRTTRFCHRYNCINLAENWEPPGMGGAPRLEGHEILPGFARYHRYGNDAD